MADESSAGNLQSAPSVGQSIAHEGTTYTTIKEGLAYILVPPDARTSVDPQSRKKQDTGEDKPQNVFYNPIQQFNRDLSVLAIKAFGEDLCEKRLRKLDIRAELKKKSSKKQKKRQDRGGEDSVKRRKGNDGNPVVAEVEQTTNGQDGASKGGPIDEAGEEQEEGVIGNGSSNEAANTNGHTTHHKPTFTILDALSATGLRALRYAQEIPFASSITANDLLTTATAAIAMNVAHNKLEAKIKPTTSNAIAHMYNAAFSQGGHEYGKYDVIDLDPYGTAAPFLDAAIQSINDNGLLCVTCTDAGVWASCGYVEKTYSLYGGLPLRGAHSHEAGLRLILHSIASTAARYGISIEPLLSLSIDFYARVFVRVRKSPADVKLLAGKTMLVHQCDSGCGAWSTQMLAQNKTQTGPKGGTFQKHSAAQSSSDSHCLHCGFKTHVAGPMWGGPLHNPYFITRILSTLPELDTETYATRDRVEGMLTSALEELDVLELPNPSDLPSQHAKDTPISALSIPALPPQTIDPHPFFFNPSALSKVLHCQAPSEAAVKGALRHLGYKATRSHTKPGCIKTQAPWTLVWEVMREWVRQRAPIKETAIKEGTAGKGVMRFARTVIAESGAETGGETGGEIQGDKEAAPASSSGSDGTPTINGVDGETTDVDATATATAAAPENGKDTTTSTKSGSNPKTNPPTPSDLTINFDEQLGKDINTKRLLRYQLNPRANWGPMARAKGPA